MDLNTIVILGLCVVLFIVLILLYIKDSQTNKKFDRYDHIVTDNINELFIIKKEIKALKESVDSIDIINLADTIDEIIDEKLKKYREN
ncbi:MAG: hypothetical protein GX282_00355 [Campylobacteraceae bacterium]|nr:hypothetical protein [Campylobacteraceae bacterium]